MKTNESLLVVVPLLKKYGKGIEILDTLDSIAEKGDKVKQVAIYSDSSDYLQEFLNECYQSSSFSGFSGNVTTCVLGEGSDVSGIIEIALEDFSDCEWVLVLDHGDYLCDIPEILPDSRDYTILSYNEGVSCEVSCQYLPNSDTTDRYGIIIESAFLKGTKVYMKYEDPQYLSYLFLEAIKNRARVFTSSQNSLCENRNREVNYSSHYDSFQYFKSKYTEIWNMLKDDSINEEVLGVIQQWLWNTLNKFYVLSVCDKYTELYNDMEFLLRGGMKDQFNK